MVLFAYEGEEYGFFNYGRGERFYDTLHEVDRFLISLGYLHGPPTLEQFRLLNRQHDASP